MFVYVATFVYRDASVFFTVFDCKNDTIYSFKYVFFLFLFSFSRQTHDIATKPLLYLLYGIILLYEDIHKRLLHA